MNENPYASPTTSGSDSRRPIWMHATVCIGNGIFASWQLFLLTHTPLTSPWFFLPLNLLATVMPGIVVFQELKRRRKERWDAFSSR